MEKSTVHETARPTPLELVHRLITNSIESLTKGNSGRALDCLQSAEVVLCEFLSTRTAPTDKYGPTEFTM